MRFGAVYGLLFGLAAFGVLAAFLLLAASDPAPAPAPHRDRLARHRPCRVMSAPPSVWLICRDGSSWLRADGSLRFLGYTSPVNPVPAA